jgi:lipopolysaccharide transport system permease protein
MNKSQTKEHQSHTSEVIYTPHVHSGLSVWGEMGRDLIRSRELIWRLVLRDLSARYRQSVLGYFWTVTPTIVTVVIFSYLNRLRILPIGETEIPYPCYVLLGLTVWQLFASGLAAAW